jgi:hypothetical protein
MKLYLFLVILKAKDYTGLRPSRRPWTFKKKTFLETLVVLTDLAMINITLNLNWRTIIYYGSEGVAVLRKAYATQPESPL